MKKILNLQYLNSIWNFVLYTNKKNVDSFYFLLISRKTIQNKFLKSSSFIEMMNLYLFSINNNTNKIDREIINQHFNSND